MYTDARAYTACQSPTHLSTHKQVPTHTYTHTHQLITCVPWSPLTDKFTCTCDALCCSWFSSATPRENVFTSHRAHTDAHTPTGCCSICGSQAILTLQRCYMKKTAHLRTDDPACVSLLEICTAHRECAPLLSYMPAPSIFKEIAH